MFLRTTRGAQLVFFLALAVALPAGADYEAGQRSLDAGKPAAALEQWRTAAAAGDAQAMLGLGRLYLQGLGVLQDYVEAHKWFSTWRRAGARLTGQESATHWPRR